MDTFQSLRPGKSRTICMVYFKMPGSTVMTRDLDERRVLRIARGSLNKPESWRMY